jgi:hypothetical protein
MASDKEKNNILCLDGGGTHLELFNVLH